MGWVKAREGQRKGRLRWVGVGGVACTWRVSLVFFLVNSATFSSTVFLTTSLRPRSPRSHNHHPAPSSHHHHKPLLPVSQTLPHSPVFCPCVIPMDSGGLGLSDSVHATNSLHPQH